MKQKSLAVLFLFVMTTTLIAADASSDFKTAVDSAVKDFTAGLTAKDATRVGSVYTTDAIVYPPNSEMVQGRDAISAFWKTLIDAGMSAQLETLETESDGNLGMDTGKFKILDKAGKEIDHGKYVVVWKKEKGAWKIYRDIWNSSIPAAAP